MDLSPVLSFLAGATTAIFAEPIRSWLFRPAIRVSFDPETCYLLTDTWVGPSEGPKTPSRGYWIRVRVRTTRNRIARGCRAFLIKVEIKEQGVFRPSVFVDSQRLKWSSHKDDEAFKPIDVPKGVFQFVDVLSTDRASPNQYNAHALFVPAYCSSLFDARAKTLRLTILVVGDETKPKTARLIFRWNGAWDTFGVWPA